MVCRIEEDPIFEERADSLFLDLVLLAVEWIIDSELTFHGCKNTHNYTHAQHTAHCTYIAARSAPLRR